MRTFTSAILQLVLAAVVGGAPALAQVTSPRPSADAAPRIDALAIHPAMAARFVCAEHPYGQEDHAGDALGQDCTVVRDTAGPTGRFPAFYSGSGSRNADWFSWNEPLLAPFSGIVKAIHLNPSTNDPGVRGSGMASVILFERIGAADERPIQVGYVHVQDVRVAVGDTVAAGQVVARIGNNGISDHPHVHIGAVRGDLGKLMSGAARPEDVEALQVRFDLVALGRLRGYVR